MPGETAGQSRWLAPKDFVSHPDSATWNWSAEEAARYTRWLATRHYENFHVVSFLLPKRLHQDFFNVYSFCRWADDLGDEMGDTEQSLRRFSAWYTFMWPPSHGEGRPGAPVGTGSWL